jgi:hypothetical protein
MIDKLARAFTKLLAEVKELRADVRNMPTPKNGEQGKPGVSPEPEAIAELVLAQLPTIKDGEPGKDADIEVVIKEVLARIPTPKDGKPGRDAQPPLLADVAALVLAQIPKPKDGVSPDPKALAAAAAKLIPKPKDGVSPSPKSVAALVKVPTPKQGKPGKNGASITDVRLERNILSVWIDGVKKRVGKIDPPAQPAFAQGGNTVVRQEPAKTVGYTPQGTLVSEDLQVGALDTPSTVTFGAGGSTAGGGATVGADGVITVNEEAFWSIKQRFRAGRAGASGVSDLFFWAEISTDGGATWNILGSSVSIPLNTSSDTVVFFDIANIQVPVGTKLRNQFARSSTGDDSGDLRVGLPSAALQAIGVQSAPSAQITFYKIDQ